MWKLVWKNLCKEDEMKYGQDAFGLPMKKG